jgi:alpha-L-fucosidase 2
VKGLRARGGFEVDVTWKDGSLVEATVISLSGGAATLRLGSTTREIKLQKGGKFRWEGN